MRVSTINYLALALFLLTACFSIGHNQSDEHYQVLEFAQYQLGYISAEELPWEFGEHMRPSLQPWLAVLLIKFFAFFGISNPFIITGFLRLLSALLLWGTMVKLNELLIRRYFPQARWALVFSACTLLLWYVPFISVRFSSENYSTLCLLLGLYYLLRDELPKPQHLLAAGLLFGCSFLFRYQLGLAIAGIGAWCLFVVRARWQQLLPLLLSGLAVVALGSYLDTLFYGEPVFAPYNYFHTTLLAEQAPDFGADPIWFSLVQSMAALVPPVSLVLLAGFVYGAWRIPRHVFLWAIVPFLLIHCLIPHKEVRFLFPVHYLFVFLAVYGVREYFMDQAVLRWQQWVLRVAIGLNGLVLLLMAFRPAHQAVIFCRYVYHHIDEGERTVVSTHRTFYKLMGQLKTTFYTPPNTQSYYADTVEGLSAVLQREDVQTCFYVHRGFALQQTIEGYEAELVYSIYPDFVHETTLFDPQKIRTQAVYVLRRK